MNASPYSPINVALQWRHNGHNFISNLQSHDCLLNRLFRRRSKKTSKTRVTSLCAVNSPLAGEFPAQRASNAENVSIWWCHHGINDQLCSWKGLIGPISHGIDRLAQDWSNSSTNALELLQSCADPSKCSLAISRIQWQLCSSVTAVHYNNLQCDW